jgi:hypothetical protein
MRTQGGGRPDQRRAARQARPFGGAAPRRYHLEDYKRWFPKTESTFLRYLKRSAEPRKPHPSTGGTIGVVVMPWVSTPVPWYSIMLAIGLSRRGRNVVLLWDDTAFDERYVEVQNRAIGKVLSRVGRSLTVVRLSDGAPSPVTPTDDALVETLTNQNVTWILRGRVPTDQEQRVVDRIKGSLTRSLPLVRTALDRPDVDCLVVPGGVYGTSGLYVHEGNARGFRVATFDTDRRIAQICASGVAAQNGDIPRAFNALWGSGEQSRAQAIEIARAEFQSRLENNDSYGFQALPAGGSGFGPEGGVLIPLNVEWDTAALGRHVHFANTTDWVTATVERILDRDAGPVIVRQHPSERRKLQRSQLDVALALRERFGDDPRCRFVAADDPISSYDLLVSARLVLPFVSTIAMEAAGIGKPVLISGSCYYSGLGFVWSAASRQDYFELLDRGLSGELPPLPDQSARAWTCYYLAAVTNRVSTDFTPHPDDFWSWCRRTPDSLFSDPEVSDILEALDTDTPISLLRHLRLSAPHGSPPTG